ncbi:MAG: hypothetical protein ACU0CI_10645 [Shimia sp.]
MSKSGRRSFPGPAPGVTTLRSSCIAAARACASGVRPCGVTAASTWSMSSVRFIVMRCVTSS